MHRNDLDPAESTTNFATWLGRQGLRANTSASAVTRVMRLADAYGDLRRHYDRDRLAQILTELTYGKDDERRDRPNPSRVQIKGDLRAGLASLKNAATLFRSYLEGGQNGLAPAAVQLRIPRANSPVADELLHSSQVLSSAYEAMGHNPIELVARTAIWAHPTIVARMMSKNPHATWFPAIRRKKAAEVRGSIVQDIQLDDNSYANLAIKLATFGRRGGRGFHACHVWPGTCYDPRYHTSIANLILLPAEIAGLSDHDPDVVAVLQYRAFELFGWNPDESAIPQRPRRYPEATLWRPISEPTPSTEGAVAKWTRSHPTGTT